MNVDKRGKLLVVVYAVLLVVAVIAMVLMIAPKQEERRKVGLITSGGIDEPGWPSLSYEGLQAACDDVGVELLVREHVGEMDGTCPKAVEELAKEDVEMIIMSSPSFSQEMEQLFDHYPAVSFYGIFAHYEASNITGYSARLYQARYLSGIVAGMYTQNNKIGYVAAQRVPQVIRGIDAFALGVHRVNPEAEVIVYWTDAWDDRERELQGARALIEEEKVDVITYHTDGDNVVDAAEEAGVAHIGYCAADRETSDLFLTSDYCDWKILYGELLREYMRGQSSNTISDWLGLESGAVGLTEYSPLVSQEARNEVERARAELLTGQDVFSNEIYDNQGILRCGQGEAVSDRTLSRELDWLVEGVREYG